MCGWTVTVICLSFKDWPVSTHTYTICVQNLSGYSQGRWSFIRHTNSCKHGVNCAYWTDCFGGRQKKRINDVPPLPFEPTFRASTPRSIAMTSLIRRLSLCGDASEYTDDGRVFWRGVCLYVCMYDALSNTWMTEARSVDDWKTVGAELSRPFVSVLSQAHRVTREVLGRLDTDTGSGGHSSVRSLDVWLKCCLVGQWAGNYWRYGPPAHRSMCRLLRRRARPVWPECFRVGATHVSVPARSDHWPRGKYPSSSGGVSVQTITGVFKWLCCSPS